MLRCMVIVYLRDTFWEQISIRPLSCQKDKEQNKKSMLDRYRCSFFFIVMPLLLDAFVVSRFEGYFSSFPS
jgi:hypothetical protein